MLHARANMHGVRCAAHRALAATRTIAAVAHSRPLLRASAAPTCRSATGAATAHLHTRVTHLSPTGSGSGIDKDDADAPPSRFDDDSLSSPDELDDLLEEDAEADEDRDDDAIGEDAAEEEEDTADAEKSEETIAEVEEPRQNLVCVHSWTLQLAPRESHSHRARASRLSFPPLFSLETFRVGGSP